MTLRTTGIISLFLTLTLDQAHKWFMLLYILDDLPIRVTPFFNLVMVWNPGISFGILRDVNHAQWILSAIALVIVVVLLAWMFRAKWKRTTLALGIICGGALGNVIDRFIHGAVADFFDFHAMGYHWPAFNIADSAVFIGAVMLCVESLFPPKETELKNKKDTINLPQE